MTGWTDPVTGLTSGPPPDPGPSSACMGCEERIWPTKVPLPGGPAGAVLWEDANGIAVCVKAPPGPTPPQGYVYHRPLTLTRP